MSHVTLTYFPIPGRAFPMRVCCGAALAQGKLASFTDQRLPGAEYRAKKTSGELVLPLGQVPVLTIDGKTFCQSNALAHWAANLAGIIPTDPLQALLSDEVECSMDEAWGQMPFGGDDIKERREKWAQEVIRSRYLPYLEARVGYLEGSASTGPFFLGANISLADLVVFCFFEGIASGNFDHVPADAFSTGFPKLAAMVEATKAHPMIVAHGK